MWCVIEIFFVIKYNLKIWRVQYKIIQGKVGASFAIRIYFQCIYLWQRLMKIMYMARIRSKTSQFTWCQAITLYLTSTAVRHGFPSSCIHWCSILKDHCVTCSGVLYEWRDRGVSNFDENFAWDRNDFFYYGMEC